MTRPPKRTDLMLAVRLAVQEGDYQFTKHAYARALQRNISDIEIFEVLQRGYPEHAKDKFEPLVQDWNYAIRGRTQGQRELRIVIAIQASLLIITVIELLTDRGRMETKVVKRHIDELLGFPVQLSNVTFVKVRGEWLPKINYQRLDLQVAKVLCHLHRPLRGAELRFVRLFLGLTQASLAERFGVSHVAVHKWERRRAKPSGMPWTTEKDLRLMIQSQLSDDPGAVGRLYGELKERPEPEASKTTCLSI